MYGIRVPAFVISPWVVPGSVAKNVYDHTSILSTILKRFCLDASGKPLSMGVRADNALDVGPLLSVPSMPSISEPPPLNLNTKLPVPTPNPNAFGAVLSKFLVGF